MKTIDNQIDHRSYERQGKLKIPTIHEGADARKIEEKYLTGQIWNGSWKVEENQMLTFEKVLEIFADYLTADETIEVYISRHESPPFYFSVFMLLSL